MYTPLLCVLFLLSSPSPTHSHEPTCSEEPTDNAHPHNPKMSYQDTNQSKALLYAAGILTAGAAIGYVIGYGVASKKSQRINSAQKLNLDKVVDTVDVEDLGEKTCYCRCWKSAKFPYCDGSHNAHNKETGDNIGPILVKGKAKEQ